MLAAELNKSAKPSHHKKLLWSQVFRGPMITSAQLEKFIPRHGAIELESDAWQEIGMMPIGMFMLHYKKCNEGGFLDMLPLAAVVGLDDVPVVDMKYMLTHMETPDDVPFNIVLKNRRGEFISALVNRIYMRLYMKQTASGYYQFNDQVLEFLRTGKPADLPYRPADIRL